MKLKLHWQIIIAMIAAWMFALILGERSGFVEPLGTLFIRLLKMVIVPLVILSITTSVASIGDPKSLGRLSIKTFAYYICSSLLAILIRVGLVNSIQPGQGVELGDGPALSAESLKKPASATDLILRIIPTNPVAAAAEGDMLGLIFFSILFGFVLTQVSQGIRDKVLPLIEAGFEVIMRLTHIIIKFAPLGVFGLIVAMVNQNMGAGFFKAVGLYMVTIAVGLSLHLFIVLPLILYLFTRRNPVDQFAHMASALATVFATSSSLATLPVTMECVEKNIGVSPKVANFILPLGATVNMDGTALFECVGVLFIAQVMGVGLGVDQQIIVVLTALLGSIGTAAIPSAELVVMIFVLLDTVGLKGELIPIIVGAMLAVDRPLDMYRGIISIFSDSIGAAVIAHSEGESIQSAINK